MLGDARDDRVVGRFYLDMHPRDNKYSHAAQFDIRTGVSGRQIPEAALVCNLPGGVPGDPGLMEPEDVRTVFHEFGHLIHHLSASHHRWVGISGITTEWDFVEAPSQMLENGKVVGRFYFDMHPRPGKFNHAAMFAMTTGKAGVRVPECALVCNLPRPGDEPARAALGRAARTGAGGL